MVNGGGEHHHPEDTAWEVKHPSVERERERALPAPPNGCAYHYPSKQSGAARASFASHTPPKTPCTPLSTPLPSSKQLQGQFRHTIHRSIELAMLFRINPRPTTLAPSLPPRPPREAPRRASPRSRSTRRPTSPPRRCRPSTCRSQHLGRIDPGHHLPGFGAALFRGGPGRNELPAAGGGEEFVSGWCMMGRWDGCPLDTDTSIN